MQPRVPDEGLFFLVAGISYCRPWLDGGWPVYSMFLTIFTFVQASALYRAMGPFVNRPALGARTTTREARHGGPRASAALETAGITRTWARRRDEPR